MTLFKSGLLTTILRIPSSMRVRGREVNTISSPFSGSREFTNARQRLRLPPLQARGHASPRASVHGQFDRIDKMQLPGGEEGGEQQFSASGARLKTTMLMVIFGAGASFDSSSAVPPVRDCPVRDKTYRLPLANELFEARKEFIGPHGEISSVRWSAIASDRQRISDQSSRY